MARDRTTPVILPDQDSIELQEAYADIAALVQDFNKTHAAQMQQVEFYLVGGTYGGNQRDFKGCYVNRNRSAVL